MDLPKIPESPSQSQLEKFGRVNNCHGASRSTIQTNNPNKKMLKKSAALFKMEGSTSLVSFARTKFEIVHANNVAKAAK